MNGFWQELVINWGGNAVLGGLIIYLGKIYLERIGRSEQAVIDERLKILEHDHEKLLNRDEHFHQISQQTYQNLFDRKITVYTELSRLLHDYYTTGFNERDSLMIITMESYDYFTKFELISRFIMKNSLYVSPELSELNYNWHIKYVKKANLIRNSTILFNPMEEVNNFDVLEKQNKMYGDFYDETKVYVDEISKQIGLDIKKISDFIH